MEYTLEPGQSYHSSESFLSRDDTNDEYDDNLFKGEEDTDSEICPHCTFYEMEDCTYGDTGVMVKCCKKDGYLCPHQGCYSMLRAKPPKNGPWYCPKRHELL
jgi:hypothetical protein